MRLTAIALTALLVASCGDDAPEETDTPRPTQQQPTQAVPGDTTVADSPGLQEPAAPMAPADQPGTGEGVAGQQGDQQQAASGTGDQAEAPAGDRRLYTVQVAAFTAANTANEWQQRLEAQGLPVWTSMAELGGQTFYRLRVGAATDLSEARQLGRMLTDRYEWPVWVAPVGPGEQLPAGAVEETRRLLNGS